MLKLIESVCDVARHELEEYAFHNEEQYPWWDYNDLTGVCGTGAILVCNIFSILGIRSKLLHHYYFDYIDSNNVEINSPVHAWSRVGSYFVDLTATQFGGPRVYISDEKPMSFIGYTELDSFVDIYEYGRLNRLELLYEYLVQDVGWPESELMDFWDMRRLTKSVLDQVQVDRELDNVPLSAVA